MVRPWPSSPAPGAVYHFVGRGDGACPCRVWVGLFSNSGSVFKLSVNILAGSRVLCAVGACAPHDGALNWQSVVRLRGDTSGNVGTLYERRRRGQAGEVTISENEAKDDPDGHLPPPPTLAFDDDPVNAFAEATGSGSSRLSDSEPFYDRRPSLPFEQDEDEYGAADHFFESCGFG